MVTLAHWTQSPSCVHDVDLYRGPGPPGLLRAQLHLHLCTVPRDGDAAAARRVARVQVRAAQAERRLARARRLAITGAPRNPRDRIMEQIMFLAVVVGCLLLPVGLFVAFV